MATNKHAAVEELLLEVLFSVQSMPRLSSEDHWEKIASYESEFNSHMLEIRVSLEFHR
jgi:hypothetical protein